MTQQIKQSLKSASAKKAQKTQEGNFNPWGHFQPVSIPSEDEEFEDTSCCDGEEPTKKKKPLQSLDEDLDELKEKLNSYANQSEKFKQDLRNQMISACENQRTGIMSDLLKRYPVS